MAQLEQLIYAPKPEPKKPTVEERAALKLEEIRWAYGHKEAHDTWKDVAMFSTMVIFWILWYGLIGISLIVWCKSFPEYRLFSASAMLIFVMGLGFSITGVVVIMHRVMGYWIWPHEKRFDGVHPHASVKERVNSLWTDADRQWQTDRFYWFRGEGKYPRCFWQRDVKREFDAQVVALADSDKFMVLPEDEQVEGLVKRVLFLLVSAQQEGRHAEQ